MTEEDLSIIEEVQQHFEEEQSQELEEGSIDNFVCSLTKCYIPGCEVHTLLPNCIHYGNISGLGYGGLEDMSQRMKKVMNVLKEIRHVHILRSTRDTFASLEKTGFLQ